MMSWIEWRAPYKVRSEQDDLHSARIRRTCHVIYVAYRVQALGTEYICLRPKDGELADIMVMDESTSRY